MRERIADWISGVGQRSIERSVVKAVGPKGVSPVLTDKFKSVTGTIHTPPARTARNALSAYESNPFVYVVIDRVAGRVAGQDWFLKARRGEGKKVVDHPALAFLRAGSEIMDGYQSRKMIQMHLDLAGECFLLIGYDSDGKPASYLPIPPTWVTKPAYRDGETFDITIPRTSATAKVPWRGMIWVKRPRPADPLDRGFSPTSALLTEISLHDEMSNFFYSFVKNRARPDIIITGSDENPIDEKDARALEARWTQNHGGTNNAGKPMFSNVPVEIHEVGATMQETQTAEMRKLSRDFILQVYGVQPSVFGIIENANRATAEAADFTMARDVAEPRLIALREAFYPRLLIEFPDLVRFRLHFDSPVAEDKEFYLNVLRAAPSAFKINHALALAGQEPDPERGDEYLKEDVGGTAGTDAADPNALADGNTDSDKKPKKGKKALVRAISAEQAGHLAAGLEDNRDGLLLLMLSTLRSAAIQAALDTAPARGVSLDAVMASADAWATARAGELLDQINATSAEALKAAVAVAGDDRAKIGGAIILLFAEWARERALLIASTEANGALSAVQDAIGKAVGATDKVWLTQLDQRVRDLHRPMHGQVQPIAANFLAPNGEKGPGPGRFPSAAMNVNCRCGTHTFAGKPPEAETLASLAAAHDTRLRLVETVTAGGVRAVLHEQQRAVLSRLGSIPND